MLKISHLQISWLL